MKINFTKKLSRQEFCQLNSLIQLTWGLENSVQNNYDRKLLVKLFIFLVLMSGTGMFIARNKHEICGVIVTTLRQKRSYFARFSYFAQFLIHAWRVLFMSRQAKTYLSEQLIIFKAYKKLASNYEKIKDQIELFAVSPKYQGSGLGKNLLNYALSEFKEEQINEITLFTDSRCNFGFYDYNNFVQVSSIELSFRNGDKELAMLYKKTLI